MAKKQFMKTGTLFGIGIGPGDPELITVKAVRILERCRHVFVPTARNEVRSVALEIARDYIHSDAVIQEMVFPMTTDQQKLRIHWEASARAVADVLERGSDACFLTLGDAFLYSTYIYLVRALRKVLPQVTIVTVPGVTAFSAAAALAEFPVGEAKERVTIIPTADDLEDLKNALESGGTVVLMKIGKRLHHILALIESYGLLDHGVFVSRAGMNNERVVKHLGELKGEDDNTGYLSIILVRSRGAKPS